MTDTLLENAVMAAGDADVLPLQIEHCHNPCICRDRKTQLHVIFLCEVRWQEEQVRNEASLRIVVLHA